MVRDVDLEVVDWEDTGEELTVRAVVLAVDRSAVLDGSPWGGREDRWRVGVVRVGDRVDAVVEAGEVDTGPWEGLLAGVLEAGCTEVRVDRRGAGEAEGVKEGEVWAGVGEELKVTETEGRAVELAGTRDVGGRLDTDAEVLRGTALGTREDGEVLKLAAEVLVRDVRTELARGVEPAGVPVECGAVPVIPDCVA